MTPNQVGEAMALMGKARESVPAEFLAGYDAKRAAMAAEQARIAARFAEYDRLAALGHTDAEIEKIMTAWD